MNLSLRHESDDCSTQGEGETISGNLLHMSEGLGKSLRHVCMRLFRLNDNH